MTWITPRPGRWYSWGEFCVSSTIDPLELTAALMTAPRHQVAIVRLVAAVLDPIREVTGPIIITSGYRTERLNTAIGGATRSDHLSGRAADIKLSRRHDAGRILDVARMLHLPADQIITYDITRGGHCHVSYRADPGTAPRRQYLHAPRGGGYMPAVVG